MTTPVQVADPAPGHPTEPVRRRARAGARRFGYGRSIANIALICGVLVWREALAWPGRTRTVENAADVVDSAAVSG